MNDYKELDSLPQEFYADWLAGFEKATPTNEGVFRLVGIEKTEPFGWRSQRVTVLVIDENGFPIPNVSVAFSYSTADFYSVTDNFKWIPPSPRLGFIVKTEGSGQIDQVQGSAVEEGKPGGITVYILEPQYSSDIVTGMGMLGDHSGIHLTFQLKRTGHAPYIDRIKDLEDKMSLFEQLINPSS